MYFRPVCVHGGNYTVKTVSGGSSPLSLTDPKFGRNIPEHVKKLGGEDFLLRDTGSGPDRKRICRVVERHVLNFNRLPPSAAQPPPEVSTPY